MRRPLFQSVMRSSRKQRSPGEGARNEAVGLRLSWTRPSSLTAFTAARARSCFFGPYIRLRYTKSSKATCAVRPEGVSVVRQPHEAAAVHELELTIDGARLPAEGRPIAVLTDMADDGRVEIPVVIGKGAVKGKS